jgi:hypothetical protein
MANSQDVDVEMEDDYDEQADSDFNEGSAASAGSESSSSDDEDSATTNTKPTQPQKRRRAKTDSAAVTTVELDSGDEATIKEHKKERRKQRKKGEYVEDDAGNESEGWRARTRAMRDRDQEEHKKNKLASTKDSTVDVDKLWEEMNRPGYRALPPITVVGEEQRPEQAEYDASLDKENLQPGSESEYITIKRTYKFAGEVHVEEKRVLRDSAEAKLWLAQQASKSSASSKEVLDSEGLAIRRPLRKISRFDPNYANLEAFKGRWTASKPDAATGPKLNVVEKSRMDWASHVDREGLQEELKEHARAKDSYLSRDDFLRQVEARREDEAREARLRGK